MPKRIIPLLISILAGALSTPLAYFYVLAVNQGAGEAYSVWLWCMYPILLVLAVFLGYRWSFRAWQYGVLAVISSYMSALIIIPGVGSLLPVEISAELFYSIPAGIAGWLGGRVSDKRQKGQKTGSGMRNCIIEKPPARRLG